MTDQVYRTASGKVIDMGAIIIQNEGTVPAGNLHKVRQQEARNKRHAEAKQKANDRLNKKRILPGRQLIEPKVPLSEGMQMMMDRIKAKSAGTPPSSVELLPDLSDLEMPAEIGAQIDFTAIAVEDQINAIADGMLNDLTAMEQSDLEIGEDVEEDVAELTGLAAALARVRTNSAN